ncbi:MAG: hypothetical protein AB7L90_23535 [Hyphomicrobiaceae bacterium]
MDPSIVIFVVGSGTSFIAFYWFFNRRIGAVEARQRADRARHFGLRKLSFIDDLRHEAGLRAESVINAAAERVRSSSAHPGSAPISAATLERLKETRSMLQPLLPDTFTAEFDHIVRVLHAAPAMREMEIDAALGRLARQVAAIGAATKSPPRRRAIRLDWRLSRLLPLRTAGDAR